MAGWSPNAPRFRAAFRRAALNRKLWRTSRKQLLRGSGQKIKRLRVRASRESPKFWSQCERLARLRLQKAGSSSDARRILHRNDNLIFSCGYSEEGEDAHAKFCGRGSERSRVTRAWNDP